MLHKSPPRQETCFIPGSLSDYVPDDHILKQVHAVLDLSWLFGEVQDLYSVAGRPALDPERALRLMLAGFFHGIVHDRALLREAQVNLAYRWFAGYALDEPLPDHSTLTYLRRRWGEARSRQSFERTVAQRVAAGLVGGHTLHVDASLIRADVSWSSLVVEHVDRVLAENEGLEGAPPSPSGSSFGRQRLPQIPHRRASTTCSITRERNSTSITCRRRCTHPPSSLRPHRGHCSTACSRTSSGCSLRRTKLWLRRFRSFGSPFGRFGFTHAGTALPPPAPERRRTNSSFRAATSARSSHTSCSRASSRASSTSICPC